MPALIVILIIAFFAWIIYTQIQARKQVTVHASQGRTGVQQAIDEVFGNSWNRVNGPGYLNLKPKLRGHAPTISIDVGSSGQGGSDVDIWMSGFSRRYGTIAHAQLVWRKKRRLAAKLSSSLGTSTMGARPASTPAAQRTPAQSGGPKPARVTDGSSVSKGSGVNSATTPITGLSPNAQVCKILSESECSFVVRTKKTPREIAQAVKKSLGHSQQGSLNHLLIGPPRATMWAYVLEGSNGSNLLAISLVTKDNPDRDFVENSVRLPLREVVLPDLEGALETPTGGSLGKLKNEILQSRVVPASEYA